MRVALAGILFCSTLYVGLGQVLPGSSAAAESSSVPTTPLALVVSPPAHDDGEWRPQHDPTASISESIWKLRSLHAGLAASPRPETLVAIPSLKDALRGCTTAAPTYLLHTPLLI